MSTGGRILRILAIAAVAAAVRRAVRRASVTARAGGAPELLRSAMVEGILMRWEEHGPCREGPVPIVLVHGIPTGPRAWRHVIPHLLRERVCCLAWEMVGYGGSMAAGLGRDISVARQAQYLRAWLDHRGIRQAVLVGHDLGGGVVQRFAVAHPERVLALVLADCIAYDNWPVAPVRAARAMRRALVHVPPLLLRSAFVGGLARFGHDDPQRGMESAALHWEPYARPIGPLALAHQLACLDARDTLEIAPHLRRLGVPARIVWGERDPLPLRSAERLARDLRAPLTCIPGGAHFTLEDHPEVIARAVREVLPDRVARGEEIGAFGGERLDAQSAPSFSGGTSPRHSRSSVASSGRPMPWEPPAT